MYSRSQVARLLATALLFACGGIANASTIATIELQASISDPALAMDDTAQSLIILGGVGFDIEFSGLYAGTTIQSVADATTAGADFGHFVATLTNGIDNALEIFTGVTDIGGFDYRRDPESVWFAGLPGLSGPDLRGYVIDAIAISVTDIEYLAATGTLNARTIYAIQGHAVPVPAAWLLLASALGGLGAANCPRRRDRA